jgi:hypothetical protein
MATLSSKINELSGLATAAQGTLADTAVQPNDSPAFATVTVTNITDGTDTVATGYVVNGSAKAWVHATDTVVIRDSFNVASGVDNGTGDYTYTYTAALASTYYSSQANVRVNSGNVYTCNTNVQTATTIKVGTYRASTDARFDREHLLAVLGDLA